METFQVAGAMQSDTIIIASEPFITFFDENVDPSKERFSLSVAPPLSHRNDEAGTHAHELSASVLWIFLTGSDGGGGGGGREEEDSKSELLRRKRRRRRRRRRRRLPFWGDGAENACVCPRIEKGAE